MDINKLLAKVEAAVEAKRLSGSAAEKIRVWLTEAPYQAYVEKLAAHIEADKWKALDKVFWEVIPFGTGGRRGPMYDIGCNAINDRTIGESAQGLANYIKELHASKLHGGQRELSCGIAYDTRHNSRHFAELCAGIMVEAGFKVYFLDDYRSTPELSFLVRSRGLSCGIMVTASHNPPSDNAVKVYSDTGGQVLPPHDTAIIKQVMNVQEIRSADFHTAVQNNQIEYCTEWADREFQKAVLEQKRGEARELKLIYSPLHGVGESAVCPVLEADGFNDVEVFEAHRQPDGDFPNVPGQEANPENAQVFDAIIERAKQIHADLILATDPDCDRMGAAAPLTLRADSPWKVLTGNQLGVLLADFVLQNTPQLDASKYLAKTLVTTEMIRRVGDGYGVPTFGNLLVGFKWIGGLLDQRGGENFLLGMEESHGYLAGDHVRDKDGALACMLMAELAAACKADAKTVCEKLDELYWQYGYHAERLINLPMEGSAGKERLQQLMEKFRRRAPRSIAGIPVAGMRDYLDGTYTPQGRPKQPLKKSKGQEGSQGISLTDDPGGSPPPEGNLIFLDLETQGHYVAVRPSGTQPKVKFYLFTYVPPEQLVDLEKTKRDMDKRLDQMEAELRDFVAEAAEA